jgi:(E)-4-hydroxy-3-methylbut-2-enyl-diphosphate synthase
MKSNKLYQRFATRVVHVGNVPLGGDYPVRVQSMTNTDTLDTISTVEQAIRMIEAGCEYVRITAPGLKEAENLREIKKELLHRGYNTPIIADVHFNPKIAEIAAGIVEKVRINPGNYVTWNKTGGTRDKTTGTRDAGHGNRDTGHGNRDTGHGNDLIQDVTRHVSRVTDYALEQTASRLSPLIKICKDHGTAIRIGVNHGSLSERIMDLYGDTPRGMVQSAMEFARICESLSFYNLVLSMKASNTKVMIAANRMLVEQMKKSGMNYPIHLGVTEAGAGEDGRIKSAIGIGSLLADGIGDTIRVSLTEDPEFEIPVAYNILQAAGARITKTEFIACPSCGRTQFNIQSALEKIQARTSHLPGLKIAVMGCIVNGPGEMADASYGYVGAGKGKIHLYKGQQLVQKNIGESIAVEALIELIKVNGDWTEASHLDGVGP